MNFIQKYPARVGWLVIGLLLFQDCASTIKTSTNSHPNNIKLEQEASLRKQKEEKLKRPPSEESVKQDAKLTLKIMKENAPKVRLNEYFDAIAYAENTASANVNIKKGLAMFTSSETPVLMLIGEQNGKKQYDTPTTIKTYFNYLKDQKKNINDIRNLKIDSYGKITEVELKKNY